MLLRIETADDPRLEPYLRVRERDLGRRDGLFVIEGRIALERAIEAARFPLESVFLLEGRVAALTDVLARLSPDVPVYVAAQDVLDQVAGFHLHRGVLALARRGSATGAAALLDGLGTGPALVLGLIGLSNHDNVGGCFRNAAAFGAGAVLLDETCCDPLYRKAIRVSSGAALTVPFAHSGTSDGMIEAFKACGFEAWALSPSGGEPLSRLEPPPRLALLLGAEGPGLPASVLACVRRVTIPMATGFDSLNVATAGAIALAHAFARRQRS
jgi:tRNA G18 (ribose-2'-O)-methylase SpoU